VKSDEVTLTIFANFRIDSEERLTRMKDSFKSFWDADIEKWVINVRGPYKLETIDFLQENLGDKLVAFDIETSKGWFHDSKLMLSSVSSRYVMLWVEDHICLRPPADFNNVIRELSEASIEYFQYSWFANGLLPASFSRLEYEESDSTIYLDYGPKENEIRQKSALELYGRKYYILSLCGIFSLKMFKKILSRRDPLYRRWPKETPFDFEKRSYDIHWLPIRLGIPKKELFAQIDDDNGIEGSSLQSRGLYPVRVERKNINYLDEKKSEKKLFGCVRKIGWIREIYFNSSLLKKLRNLFIRLPYQF